MRSRLALICVGTVLLVSCASPVPESTQASAPAPAPVPPASTPAVGRVAPPTTEADMIKSAMSAAPDAIAKDATIITVDGKGTMKTLRAGTNGWTCMPDGPSPGVDPMCVDKNGADWAMAWMAHQDPPKDKLGFGYMLMGGSDASNTDPFATKPNAADHWVETGPHVMVLNIGDKFAGYPTTPGDAKSPYVMFPNTPYAHLMIPVK